MKLKYNLQDIILFERSAEGRSFGAQLDAGIIIRIQDIYYGKAEKVKCDREYEVAYYGYISEDKIKCKLEESK